MNLKLKLGILCSVVPAAASGAPEVAGYSIDAGGSISTGGTISVHGVIGQPDAGPTLTGGDIELTGGFLAVLAGPGGMGLPGCNAADVAMPFGVLDLSDINVFINGFTTQGQIADVNNDGVFDLADINVFIAAFTAGCP